MPPPPAHPHMRPGSMDRRVLKITMDGRIARTSAEDAGNENEYAKMKCLVCPQDGLLDDNTLNHTLQETYGDYNTGLHHGCHACGKCHLTEQLYISPGIEETQFRETGNTSQPDIVIPEQEIKRLDANGHVLDSDRTYDTGMPESPQMYFFNSQRSPVGAQTGDRRSLRYLQNS